MPFNYNLNGSIAPFTSAQIVAMGIESLGIEDGTYPQFTREVNQNTMRAEFLVFSDQLDNFFCFMLGGAARYSAAGFGPMLSRLLPQELTYQGVTYTNFCAVKIENTTGHQFTRDDTAGNDYPIPNYTKQRVRVLFQQVPFNLLADDDTENETQRYLQQLPTNSQVDYLSLPGAVAKYVNYPGQPTGFPGGSQVPYGTGFPTSNSIVSQKWIRLPYNCWGIGSDLYATIFGDVPTLTDGLVGTVNQTDFLGY